MAPITQLLLALAITVLSALISLVGKWKLKDKNSSSELPKSKIIIPNSIAVFAFLIALCGATLSYCSGSIAIDKQIISDSLATVKSKKADSLTDLLLKKQEKINAQTDTILYLSNKVTKIVTAFNNDFNGYNSVPIVSSVVFLYSSCKTGNHDYREKTDYDCKWVLQYNIKNIGTYRLSDVKTYMSKSEYRKYTAETIYKTIPTMFSQDSSSLGDPIIIGTEGDNIGVGPKGMFMAERYYTIRVKWKSEYKYKITLGCSSKGCFTKINEAYIYKEVNYPNASEMVKEIQKDLLQQKGIIK